MAHKYPSGHLLEKNWENLGKSWELGCFLLNDFDSVSNYGIKIPKFLGNCPKIPKSIFPIFPILLLLLVLSLMWVVGYNFGILTNQ